MKTYHKIQTIFKRDMNNKGKIMENVYSLPEFEYLKDNKWVFTEKVDGTNVRVHWDGYKISFRGRIDNAQLPMPLIERIQELFGGNEQIFEEKFGKEGNVCLYGEGYGVKIQKGGSNYIRDGVSFVLFDVRIDDLWLERKNVEDIADYFGLKIVPIIGEGTLSEAVEITRKGFNSQWGNFKAEGIVLRPKIELKTRRGDRIIAKIKYKDFF